MLIQGGWGRLDTYTQRTRQCEDIAERFEDTGLENWMMQPQAKERCQPREAGRGKEQILPESLGGKHGPENTLILVQCYWFQTSGSRTVRE